MKIPECLTINKGILTKGLAVTFTDYFAKVKELVDGFVATRRIQFGFFGFFYDWDEKNNFIEFDTEYYYLIAAIDSIAEFLIEVSKSYSDYILNIEIALFIYNIFAVTLIFFFIWRKFLTEMASRISETSNLLTLMPIEALLVNPYIMSYIKKEKNRLRY